MAAVIADLSVTLDGFVADPSDRVDQVFAWYSKGQEMVAIASPSIAQQCLNAGLLDALRISLAGARRRHPAARPPAGHADSLDDHPQVTRGVGVTHLQYPVKGPPVTDDVVQALRDADRR